MVFIAPLGKRFKFSFRLTWLCTSNAIEYEAICLGLEQAHKMKIKNLMVFGDSDLVVNQVTGKFSAKHHYLKVYRNRVWDLMESFEAFNYRVLPRKGIRASGGA